MAIHNHQGQERESKFHPERNGTTIKMTFIPQTGSREQIQERSKEHTKQII